MSKKERETLFAIQEFLVEAKKKIKELDENIRDIGYLIDCVLSGTENAERTKTNAGSKRQFTMQINGNIRTSIKSLKYKSSAQVLNEKVLKILENYS